MIPYIKEIKTATDEWYSSQKHILEVYTEE